MHIKTQETISDPIGKYLNIYKSRDGKAVET